LLVAEAWRSHRRIMRALRPRPLPPRLEHYPSVSVIRPIKGLDRELDQNIRAGLDSGYPGDVQTIFVFDDEEEPALPLVHEAIAEHRAAGRPGSVEIMFCGQPVPNQTGKLNAMIVGMTKATGELIAFADSDMRSDREVLRIMVETLLTTEGAGSAFPTVNVSEPARTAGDVDVAIMLNSLYTPMSALMMEKNEGELPFILGQYMVFTRQTLDDVVGLSTMRGQFVDDLHIGVCLKEAGLRNMVAPRSIRIIEYGYGLRESFDIYCRWMTFSRSGMQAWSYKMPEVMRALIYFTGLVGGIAAAVTGLWLASALFSSAFLAINHSLHVINRKVGGAPIAWKYYLLPGAYFLIVPFIFARVYLQRRIEWRGRSYALGSDGRLADESGAEPEVG